MKSILHLAFALLACASILAEEKETTTARALRIQVPRVDLREATLRETCEFLSQISLKLDSKRVNIIIAAEAPGRITLNLSQIPLLEALREAAALVECEVQEEPYALVIRKKGAPKLPAIVVDAKWEAVQKLDQIVIPVVDVRDATPREVYEFLAQRSKQLDAGVGMMTKLGDQGGGGVPAPAPPVAPPAVAGIPGLDADPAAKAAPLPARILGPHITLRCDNVPLLEVMRYAAGLAGHEVALEEFGIIIRSPKAIPPAR